MLLLYKQSKQPLHVFLPSRGGADHIYLRILSHHDTLYQLCLTTSEDSKAAQDCMISLNTSIS